MGSNTQHVPQVDKFELTSEFRERAIYFNKHKMYTDLPKGTSQYKEFWEEEDFRCRHGFTNSVGIRVTGIHYFYLNYVQIKAEDVETGRKKINLNKRRSNNDE